MMGSGVRVPASASRSSRDGMTQARCRLAALIAKNLGEEPTDLRPRLTASAYIAMLGECARYRLEHAQSDETLGANPYAEYLAEFAAAGLEAIAAMPKPAASANEP